VRGRGSSYRFVPLDPTKAVHARPVLHDAGPHLVVAADAGGTSAASERSISGELRCTLRALTPLLAANDQYEAQHVDGAKLDGESVSLPQGWDLGSVTTDKKILEPLRLSDGRVAIPGSALKGMLRHAVGALLSAPMERVAERSFSYRPNQWIKPRNGSHRRPVPAIVITPPGNDLSGMRVELVEDIDGRRIQLGVGTPPRGAHRYWYGIDGRALLAGAFAKAHGRQHWARAQEYWAQLPAGGRRTPQAVPQEVVAHYVRTLDHLADQREGHVSGRHPHRASPEALGAAFKAMRNGASVPRTLEEGTLLWVEWDGRRISSLGHHFRYRWRYADTVRTKWTKDGAQLRSQVVPTHDEGASEGEGTSPDVAKSKDSPPTKLTGARLLFGHVRPDDDGPALGKGDFESLAGRLAFNMATSKGEPRFLGKEPGHVVPLKVLGLPRPSAVEFYLDQSNVHGRSDRGTLATYGDLPGEDPTGDLAGRKHYLHQPDAATEPACYESTNAEVVRKDQAALARFISVPGSEFLFTLRFRNLRPWELGAVLLSLAPTPERLLQAVNGAKPELRLRQRVDEYLAGWAPPVGAPRVPLFASKLGHGRPLGLGSVEVEVEQLALLSNSSTSGVSLSKIQGATRATFETECLEALGAVAGEAWDLVLLPWLEVRRYRGRTRSEYPIAQPQKGPATTLAFHNARRTGHAEGRRFDGRPRPDQNLPPPLPR
jgi:hypothetical protein